MRKLLEYNFFCLRVLSEALVEGVERRAAEKMQVLTRGVLVEVIRNIQLRHFEGILSLVQEETLVTSHISHFVGFETDRGLVRRLKE